MQHTHSSELGPVSSGESCEKYLNDLPPLVGRANSCSSSAAVSDAPMVAKVSSNLESILLCFVLLPLTATYKHT